MLQIHKYTNANTTSVQVQTEDQYQFCYRAALEYLSSFDHYTDNWQSGNVMMMMMMIMMMVMMVMIMMMIMVMVLSHKQF